MLPRLALPPSRTVLAVLAIAFVAPGLLGHDPWKAFDATTIEVARQMQLTGDWLLPRIAGEPWLEDPPLYYWAALACGALLGGLLQFHDAARLASGLFMLAAIWFVYLAARHSAPRGATREERRIAGASAALLLTGSLGLIVHAHEAVPDLASLAAACAGFAFHARAEAKPLRSGLAFGAALGIAFLSTGLLVPVVLLVAAAATAVASREARPVAFLVPGIVATLLVSAGWPLALALRAPQAADAWWAVAGQGRGEFLSNLRYFVVTASWFAWPAWPVAAWAVWRLRREWRASRVFLPLASALLALLGIALAGPAQDINAIALLAPLALLGAQGVALLRRGAANALDWFGVTAFGFFAGLVWLGYVAMMTGWPARIARNFAKSAPGFAAQFELLPFAAALVLTLAWLYVALFTASSPVRSVLRWTAGVALLWGTFATLWLPWVDHQKSYRSVALQLKQRIPAGPGCIAGTGLGAPQLAALSYHASIRTQPFDPARPDACRLILVQGSPAHERDAPRADWEKLADVGRPNDKAERYRLYQRGP
jgi:4-amino-4-deoxy-L-arabinose transferase-like glycosyltransferase